MKEKHMEGKKIEMKKTEKLYDVLSEEELQEITGGRNRFFDFGKNFIYNIKNILTSIQ